MRSLLPLAVPIVRPLVLSFGSPEFFMLSLLGITFVASLSGEDQLKGIISGGIGLMLATIGLDPISGIQRYTFGQLFLVGWYRPRADHDRLLRDSRDHRAGGVRGPASQPKRWRNSAASWRVSRILSSLVVGDPLQRPRDIDCISLEWGRPPRSGWPMPTLYKARQTRSASARAP